MQATSSQVCVVPTLAVELAMNSLTTVPPELLAAAAETNKLTGFAPTVQSFQQPALGPAASVLSGVQEKVLASSTAATNRTLVDTGTVEVDELVLPEAVVIYRCCDCKKQRNTAPCAPKRKKVSTELVGEPASKKSKPTSKRKPKSAFIIFSTSNRLRIKTEFPDLSFGDIAKEIGAQWKSLDADAKRPYHDQAAEAKILFSQEEAVQKAENTARQEAVTAHAAVAETAALSKLNSTVPSMADVSDAAAAASNSARAVLTTSAAALAASQAVVRDHTGSNLPVTGARPK